MGRTRIGDNRETIMIRAILGLFLGLLHLGLWGGVIAGIFFILYLLISNFLAVAVGVILLVSFFTVLSYFSGKNKD